MPTNNAWNQGNQATISESIAGTDTRAVISPSTLQSVVNIARNQIPWFENLGLNYASSTFSILSSDGTNLSSTNYAKVTLPSNVNRGRLIKYTLTANQSFIDATGASTITGNLFGTGAAVAWNQPMPFFIYCAASSTDTGPTFFISRVPHRQTVPPAASIGQSGSAIADIENAFFALAAVTAANYAGSSCICLGSFQMASKSAGDAWTVQALDATDNLGFFKDQSFFNYPTGQRGATNYMQPNGGTAPSFTTTQTYIYCVRRDGLSQIRVTQSNAAGGTTGAGGGAARLNLPFGSFDTTYQDTGYYVNGATSRSVIWSTSPSGYAEQLRDDSGALLSNGNYNNASRQLSGKLEYRISDTT